MASDEVCLLVKVPRNIVDDISSLHNTLTDERINLACSWAVYNAVQERRAIVREVKEKQVTIKTDENAQPSPPTRYWTPRAERVSGLAAGLTLPDPARTDVLPLRPSPNTAPLASNLDKDILVCVTNRAPKPDARTSVYHVKPNMKVEEFRKEISDIMGSCPGPNCRIMFGSKELRSGLRLHDYNIQNHSYLRIEMPFRLQP